MNNETIKAIATLLRSTLGNMPENDADTIVEAVADLMESMLK